MISKLFIKIRNGKEKLIRQILTLAAIILLLIVAMAPGILQLMYRADAQVALGNAKTVRMALQSVATDMYGNGKSIYDSTCYGGVSDEVRQKVILLSKVPGDFWILQTDAMGFEVTGFIYQEGDFKVYYTKDPLVYSVYREQNFIRTQFQRGE